MVEQQSSHPRKEKKTHLPHNLKLKNHLLKRRRSVKLFINCTCTCNNCCLNNINSCSRCRHQLVSALGFKYFLYKLIIRRQRLEDWLLLQLQCPFGKDNLFSGYFLLVCLVNLFALTVAMAQLIYIYIY